MPSMPAIPVPGEIPLVSGCHYKNLDDCSYSFASSVGLSPDLQGMEQIRRILRPTDVPDTGLFAF